MRLGLTGAEGGTTEGGVAATVVEVVACTGDACQWVVRGQTRAGFELDLKLKFVATVDGNELSGTAR